MSVAIERQTVEAMPPTTARKVTLDAVLDFMASRFEGDLIATAAEAADYAVECGYVGGPLWDEIGVSVLKDLYRLRRIHPARRMAYSDRQTEEEVPPPVTAALAKWKNAGSRYVQLGDMTQTDLRAAAAHHNSLTQANRLERDFYLALAEGLAEGETVKDRYTPQNLADLRKRVAAGRL